MEALREFWSDYYTYICSIVFLIIVLFLSSRYQKEIDKKYEYDCETIFEAEERNQFTSGEEVIAWRLVDQNNILRYIQVGIGGISFILVSILFVLLVPYHQQIRLYFKNLFG